MLLDGFRSFSLLVLLAVTANAHVGSPDIYVDGKAGPYQVFVTIRPPQVIPGIASLEVRCQSNGVSRVRAVPLKLSKAGGDFSPVPDLLQQSTQDKQFFTGSLWLMSDGSSQVRILVDGDQGAGVLAIPVPSIALTTRKMQWQLGAVLCGLGLLLAGGLIAITGASVREVKLAAGDAPDPPRTRNGRMAMAVAFAVVCLALWGGKAWWDSDATTYQQRIYKPLGMAAAVQGAVLNLDLTEPGWMQPVRGDVFARILFTRKIDDFVADHDHLMHLYAIREPDLDVIYHLHPDLVSAGKFRLELPTMPAGDYKLYADVVHETGLPETMTAPLHLEMTEGRALSGDDATAIAEPVRLAKTSTSFVLPDGYRMSWVRDEKPLRAKQGMLFRFKLTAPDGKAPNDMALYMGMAGHSAFVKSDGTVFAHIHPNGTVSMAALMLAQQQGGQMMDHSGMVMNDMVRSEVSFPYGFPSPGRYRIFVQMKHGQTIETGVFDTTAE